MHRSLDEAELFIRNRVCVVCPEYAPTARCGAGLDSGCALLRFLPEVAGAVLSVPGGEITDCVRAVRGRVCESCAQDPAAWCGWSGQSQCALDAYLPVVIRAVREAAGGRPGANGFAGGGTTRYPWSSTKSEHRTGGAS